MGSVNKVILVGNLGRDAELRYTPGGAAVATLNMATTEVWNDKAGRYIGCIDKNDYGNMLLFVERGARQAIIELHGRTSGPIFNWLKEHPNDDTFAILWFARTHDTIVGAGPRPG